MKTQQTTASSLHILPSTNPSRVILLANAAIVTCNERSDAVSTEKSASHVSVDETTMSRPRESVAAWYGADQDGQASGSIGEGAELRGPEIAGDFAEDLVGEIFEAR